MPLDNPSSRSGRATALHLVALIAGAAACASTGAGAGGTSRNASLLTTSADRCEGVRADAARDPRLDVERVPAPLTMDPAPIRRPIPPGVLRKDGSSVIRVEVLVDTLGEPDMRSFRVIESSHPWLTAGAKRAISQWTFAPALREGCKVARYYRFAATSAPRASGS